MHHKAQFAKPDALALAALRDRETPRDAFQRHVISLGGTLGRYALNELKLYPEMADKKLYSIMLLRAGMGLWLGARTGGIDTDVGFLDLTRNEQTLKAKVNMSKYRRDLGGNTVLVFDTMLATAGSMCLSLSHIKKRAKPKRLVAVCLLVAPEGLQRMEVEHPDVDIVYGHQDERLNDKGFIMPGLGDAGDRFFGACH
jgi:uracil phosphoribosyltransferase